MNPVESNVARTGSHIAAAGRTQHRLSDDITEAAVGVGERNQRALSVQPHVAEHTEATQGTGVGGAIGPPRRGHRQARIVHRPDRGCGRGDGKIQRRFIGQIIRRVPPCQYRKMPSRAVSVSTVGDCSSRELVIC